MSLVPTLVQRCDSTRSLVSQITFHEDDDDLSQISSTSFNCNDKWYAEKELYDFRVVADLNFNHSERTSSSQPVPMPERKCSINELHHLPNSGETKYETLKNAFLNFRRSRQEEGSQPLPTQGPEDRMANAKWDVDRNITPPSKGKRQLSGGFRKITMSGSSQGSMELRKPIRKVSKGRRERDIPDTILAGHSTRVDSKNYSPVRCPRHLSTTPMTAPTRKPSTQDLLTSSNSTNALRKNLSRSTLRSTGSYSPTRPRRIGSTSSMMHNQSRDFLLRFTL